MIALVDIRELPFPLIEKKQVNPMTKNNQLSVLFRLTDLFQVRKSS
jgi:hypothetical protein